MSSQQSTGEQTESKKEWKPIFSPWRHGGFYVRNVRYPDGSCVCVSDNYTDKKWRIACDPRPFEEQPTFKTREAAARAARNLLASMQSQTPADKEA